MAHIFRAKSFIGDATALSDTATDSRGNEGISGLVQYYLETNDAGGGSTDIGEVNSVTSCKLNGDRVFVLVVIEDETGSG